MNVEILGVNRNTDAAYNSLITAGRTLPWLQDTVTNSVWALWGVNYRDVRILDPQHRLFAVYNLTTYDLANAQNRESLKALFLDAARFVDTDADQLLDHWEMLNFSSLDATGSEDSDGDEKDNFTEFTFGTDPNDATSWSSFMPIPLSADPTSPLQVTFRRRAGSQLTYLLESSPTLEPWMASPSSIRVIEPFVNLFDGTGTGQTTCVLTNWIEDHGFLRVRAEPVSRR